MGTIVCLSIHPLKNILVASKVWQLRIKLLWTLVYRFLCGGKFSTPWGKYQGVRLLDCIRVCLVCEKLPNCLSKWLHYSAFPPVMNENSCCSRYSPAFGVGVVLDFCHSNRCVALSHCCFKFQFSDDICCWASFHMLNLPSVYLLWWGVQTFSPF